VSTREAFCFAHRRLAPFDVFRRDLLAPGDGLAGPLIVEDGTSTTVVHSDQSLRVNDYGHLVIATGAGGRP
jgi:N-methylhydantoinase A